MAMGKSDDEVRIFELNCWHHIRNVWFGAVTNKMSKTLQEVLADQLSEIPSPLHSHGHCCIVACHREGMFKDMQLCKRAWRSFASLHEDISSQ